MSPGRARSKAVAIAEQPLSFYLKSGKLGPVDMFERVLDETDRRRDQYVRTYYGRPRQDVVNYDLVLNTEKLGIEGAAALVVTEARRRRWT